MGHGGGEGEAEEEADDGEVHGWKLRGCFMGLRESLVGVVVRVGNDGV